MSYCPRCGAFVPKGESRGGRCGAVSGQARGPIRGASGPDRGLHIAIAAVSVLFVATLVLWISWSSLHSSLPQPKVPFPSPSQEAQLPTGSPHGPAAGPASLTDAEPASPSPAPPAETPASAGLQIRSWWHGYLFIENYQGSKPPEEDTLEIWGYIGQVEDGRCFFEIYDVSRVKDDTVPLFSFYIELYDDYFVPLVGGKDAWVLDRYLDESDVAPLTMHLENGFLEFSYSYAVEGESCQLSGYLKEDS